jgi:uncharacterized membrane protein HdeD (DUF308 family)
MPVMFKSTSTSLILLGVLAVVVGIFAIAWPGATILALVILFAVFAFMSAGLQATRAFSSGSAGPVFGHLLLGLIDLAAGVIALVWPAPTAFVLVIVVAARALAGGVAEFFAGFQSGESAGTRALLILSGLVSVAFGVLLLAPPRRRRGHPGPAVRPVRPDLRVLADHRRHPGPPGGRRRAVALGTAQRRLSIRWAPVLWPIGAACTSVKGFLAERTVVFAL